MEDDVSKTALVVDDSKSMRRMVSFVLNEAGFTTIESENGSEALEQLAGQPMDLIVTDVNMPVMDGITFVREARKLPAYKGTPILMLTTEGGASKMQEGKRAGATGWIVKPFEPTKLAEVVAKVVR